MTFLEAAIEILRRAEGTMHFSEVARLAVAENLLSHVGRDPEAAMRSCLNSAVRSGRNGEEPIIIREKPGYYGIRPGAVLPESTRPDPDEKTISDSNDEEEPVAPKTRRKTNRSRPRKAKETPEASEGTTDADTSGPELVESPALTSASGAVEFEAPSGSGLDGITDVAVVMANAMSRLVEERPELREEFDALQQPASADSPEVVDVDEPRTRSRSSRGDNRSESRSNASQTNGEDRPRRRRRRRRRGKRVDWSSGSGDSRDDSVSVHQKLLDGAESVLEESGPRSLHVRQIAETLANRGLLGGEISEIERAVTAAILLDIQAHHRASRFVARGDARYQLQGTRLPPQAAKAEAALRGAVKALHTETESQIVQWLQSLGTRSLESLIRIYLRREGYSLLSALPPTRGVGKLVVDDPDGDDDGRVLVLIVPRRTTLDAKIWDGEMERNNCSSILLFVTGDAFDDVGDARVVSVSELAQWLLNHKIGVETVQIEVPVLNMTVIESIGGLDT